MCEKSMNPYGLGPMSYYGRQSATSEEFQAWVNAANLERIMVFVVQENFLFPKPA